MAKHLSALRGLAEALGGGDQALRTVRAARVARGEPRALDHHEWERLLRTPDRRSRQGKRDLALLRRPATRRGLGAARRRRRRAPRASDPRLRRAIKGSSSWCVTVPYGKRGRTRAIPLDEDALAAIVAWVNGRPPVATKHLLLSLPRTGQPSRPLTTRDIARIAARYAAAAGLPEDRRSPHLLRQTFCTHLPDAGAALPSSRELAGHADIRTTSIYTAVSDARLKHAIEERSRQNRGARRAATHR